MRPKWLVILSVLSLALIFFPLSGHFASGKALAVGTKTSTPSVVVASTKVTPSPISTLDVLTVGTTLKNNAQRADGLYVEMKVLGEDGQEVLRVAQRGVGIDAGDYQSVYWEWRMPDRVASGTYTVQINVYAPDRTTLYATDDHAAGFQVLHR